MIPKDFYSTGEAAELLQISRSTVSRKFDQGVLSGKKNPITGERFVSRQAIITFMSQHNLPVDPLNLGKKKILVGTPDDSLFSILERLLRGDERIQMDRVFFGSDVLVKSSKEPPDLVILDEELSDIPILDIGRSLPRVLGKNVKILALTRSQGPAVQREWEPNRVFPRADLKEISSRKEIYSLLEVPESHVQEPERFTHVRAWPRVTIHLPVQICLYRLRTPYHRDRGKAWVENISCGGTFLSGIELENGLIPCEPFGILLHIRQEPLTNWRAHGRVIRLRSDGFLTAGIRFTKISKPNLKMIQNLSHG